MHVRCPHCHQPVELVDNAGLEHIDCPSCGSQFSLLGDQTTDYRGDATRTIGHFELLERLGMGQFGTVWMARDTELDRTVAVKIPRQEQLSREDVELFLREARAAAQLHHANIVSVHEVGREGETVYIVSDLVRGATLADRLTAGRMSPREAAQLCITVAEALRHAHQAGVIHRDLKPSNIMLDAESQPHLMDFGLAKREAAEITMTLDGRILGTPAYMSPEQARGEAHQADARSDIYSLGTILFELLTGELPFRGNARMLALQIIHDEPPSPRKLDATVPRDLETICLKCLEKSPDRRYATARDLADELRRYLAGQPLISRPVGRAERLWRWCRREPLAAALTLTAMLSLLLAAGVSFVAYLRTSRSLETVRDRELQARGALQAATEAADRERRAKEDTEAARRLTQTTLADMYTAAGLTAGEQQKPAEATVWFAAAAEASADPHRRWANRVRQQTYGAQAFQPVAAFKHQDRVLQSLEVHPSGRYVLAVSTAHRCQSWDAERDEPLPLTGGERTVSAAAWSPNGGQLALARPNGKIDLFSFPEGDSLEQIDHHGAVQTLAFSRDGRYLAFGGENARVWDCRSHEFATPDLRHPAAVLAISFNAAGDQIATACHDWHARVFAISKQSAADQPLFDPVAHYVLRTNAADIRTPRPVAPLFVDGDRAMVVVDSQGVHLRHPQSGHFIADCCSRQGFETTAFAVAEDGRQVAAAGFSNGTEVVEAWSLPLPSAAVQVTASGVVDLAFSPDGQSLLAAGLDDTVRLWTTGKLKPLGPPIEHQRAANLVAFDKDGRLFASAQEGGLVRVWAVPLPTRVVYRIPTKGAGTLARVSGDGHLVAPAGFSYSGASLMETRVHDFATGSAVGPPIVTGGMIIDAAFGPSGLQIAISSSPARERESRKRSMFLPSGNAGNVQIWNCRGTERICGPIGMPSEPRGIDYARSPQGNVVAVFCAAGELVLIDAKSGAILRTMRHTRSKNVPNDYAVNGRVRFSPDGRWLASWGVYDDKDVKLWDVATGGLLHAFSHGAKCHDVQFSGNGEFVSTAGFDGTARVWEARRGSSAARPLRHADWVFTAKFDDSGERLLTTSRDRTARLWNWRSGDLVCPPFQHDDEVFDAAFGPNGPWLVTASYDDTVRLWDTHSGRLLAPPFPIIGKGLSVHVSASGALAVVGSYAGDIFGLRLPEMLHTVLGNDDGYRIAAEILSGERRFGGGLVKLSDEEWYDAWRRLRHRRRDFFRPPAALEWDNAQAGFQAAPPFSPGQQRDSVKTNDK